MVEVVFVIAALAFIIFVVALNLAVGSLRSRSMSWVAGPAAPTDAWGEEAASGLDGIFDVLAGRNPEAAGPRKRTGAGPVEAVAAIENLEERDRK
ncbi:MAG: hypothetical protein ABSC46_00670 [Candidatus Limnocylindrales bacterium]|jgi:hypothetical protein